MGRNCPVCTADAAFAQRAVQCINSGVYTNMRGDLNQQGGEGGFQSGQQGNCKIPRQSRAGTIDKVGIKVNKAWGQFEVLVWLKVRREPRQTSTSRTELLLSKCCLNFGVIVSTFSCSRYRGKQTLFEVEGGIMKHPNLFPKLLALCGNAAATCSWRSFPNCPSGKEKKERSHFAAAAKQWWAVQGF